jgi:hypothetical protein
MQHFGYFHYMTAFLFNYAMNKFYELFLIIVIQILIILIIV